MVKSRVTKNSKSRSKSNTRTNKKQRGGMSEITSSIFKKKNGTREIYWR